MGRKIFITYKHNDDNVNPINNGTTARSYVEELITFFDDTNDIYKGEGNEDLSEFKDETIETHLKEKMRDSSVTIVLISPAMKDDSKNESDQWIPWEISYSLKEIKRNDRTSKTNAILAVVLPDDKILFPYYYFFKTYEKCNCQTPLTDQLFHILKKNMFNIKKPGPVTCSNHLTTNNVFYTRQPSYIHCVTWEDFIKNKEKNLKTAEEIRDKIGEYDITKKV